MTNGSSPRAINLKSIPERIGIYDTKKEQMHYFTTKDDRTLRPGSLSKKITYKYNSKNTPIEFSLHKTTGNIHVDNLYFEHERNKNKQISGKAFLTGLQKMHPTQITLSNASLIPEHGTPRERWMPRAYSTTNYYVGFEPSYNNYAKKNWTFKRNREIVKALMGNKTFSDEDVLRLLPKISQEGRRIFQTHTGKKKTWALAKAALDLVSRLEVSSGKYNNVEEEYMNYNNLINLNPIVYRTLKNPKIRPRTDNSSPQQKRQKPSSPKRQKSNSPKR